MDEPRIIDPTVRRGYDGEVLPDVVAGAPMPWLERWWDEAEVDPRVAEPDAMVLATVDADGRPDARTVLLKGLDAEGFVFYSHTTSAKGRQLAVTPSAALVLLWHPMHRQVRVRGSVSLLGREASAAYFATRPRGSQVASSASDQSVPVGSRSELENAVQREEARWPDTGDPRDVPLPEHWGGYRVRPDAVELWVGRPSRLHDRVRFDRTGAGDLTDAGSWSVTRLQP